MGIDFESPWKGEDNHPWRTAWHRACGRRCGVNILRARDKGPTRRRMPTAIHTLRQYRAEKIHVTQAVRQKHGLCPRLWHWLLVAQSSEVPKGDISTILTAQSYVILLLSVKEMLCQPARVI